MLQGYILGFLFKIDPSVWFACKNIDKGHIKVFAHITFPYNILMQEEFVFLSHSQGSTVCDLICAQHY